MNKSYELQIVTLSGIFYEGRVTSLVAPGSLGSFGVLYNHAPFISKLEGGIMKFKEQNGDEFFLEIGKGYFNILNNCATIITEGAKIISAPPADILQ